MKTQSTKILLKASVSISVQFQFLYVVRFRAMTANFSVRDMSALDSRKERQSKRDTHIHKSEFRKQNNRTLPHVAFNVEVNQSTVFTGPDQLNLTLIRLVKYP